MNHTEPSAARPPHPPSPDLVQVVLAECSAADADTVFDVLRAQFPSDRGDDVPGHKEPGRPDVWTGGFLAGHSPEPSPGVLLAGTVTADLQGGPVAVARIRALLEQAFVAQAKGTVSGDQEVQVQLRLTGADEGQPPG
ncbi:hypothetical protein H9Y04_41195 [Streptomyces sp. TRM66268-LWL]|uniref:Uncharacterized protein n=1 Tax=Streptomyces polyasparticus TaxID=2767826 RepID=A0ABR7SWI9_9ACTN|nr:hypothetical protein [Streptomyces polyasparticus]MBC9718962.1 hypothetical protein [Streptomyces polyasparticus]